MKATHAHFLLFLIFIFARSGVAQTLEIHQMSVGPADAGVIVVRDVVKLEAVVQKLHADSVPVAAKKYELLRIALRNKLDLKGTVKKAILIDAAENAAKYATKIDKYLTEIGVDKALDYVVLSHLDKDHYGGFKDLFKKYSYTVTTAAYHPDTKKGYPQPSKTCNTNFFNQTAISTKKEIAKVNNTDIKLGTENGKNIQLTCVVADCYVLGQDPAIAAQSNCRYSNDYNDHSIGWILQYGAFRFYTGGDLNGLFPKFPIETAMVDSLETHDPASFTEFASVAAIPKGHTCGIKINHHGSDNSTNARFLSVLKPKTAFISCGYHAGHAHPRKGVIADLEGANWDITDWNNGVITLQPNTLKKYFVTALLKNLPAPVNKIGDGLPTSKGIVGGDLVLIVDDRNIATESKFAVYYNGRISSVLDGKKGKNPNNKDKGGLEHFECHKASSAQPYITNK